MSAAARKKKAPEPDAPKKVYKARPGYWITDDDAKVLGEFCERVVEKHGTVSPSLFVREARHDASVRGYLEWDNDKAAERWRVQQASKLLVSFTATVEREDKEVEVVAFQYVDHERGRLPAAQVFSDAEMTQLVVERARKEAIAFFYRYQNIRDAAGIGPILDVIERELVAGKATGPPNNKRTCRICGESGHNAATCVARKVA